MDYRKVEKLESCPYNSSHQILPHRMAKHLIKCKKNYPSTDMKVCIFNAVHVVPAHQYQAHLLNCEDRQLVERELFSRPQVVKEGPLVKHEAIPAQNYSAKCDDWEADCVQSSYAPEKHVIYKEFTRPPPPGLSKGARRQWRLNEIERVNRLKNGMLLDDPQSDTGINISKTSAVSMNSDLGAGGAVPKLQGKNVKSSSSSVESDTNNGQVSQKGRQPYGATLVSSADQPTEIGSLGNHFDKSQIFEKPNHRLDMTDFIKEKRKLEKKLFEIKKLENMKVHLNQRLTDQEESKIRLKDSIMEQLSNLMARMDV